MAGDRRDHQKASVVLGYDKIGYESSSAAMSALAGKASSLATTEGNKNKECHVQFGEPGVYKRDFTTSSKLADPTGEVHKYRGQLSAADKDMLVRTSSAFTGEVAPFVTSTGLATQWDPAAVRETVALRDEIRRRTGPRPTRGMSYDDDIEYISESKCAFDNKFRSHKPSIMAASVKNDLRATHFALGYEKPDYKTSAHIDKLSPEDFKRFATRPAPLHDLKKSTVEIS